MSRHALETTGRPTRPPRRTRRILRPLFLGLLISAMCTAGMSQIRPAAPEGMLAISVSHDRILRGGEPWWFLGYNSYTWSGDCGTRDERMRSQDVDMWFASMRHDGHGAARLFFFPGWDTARLDAAVASARQNNVYLIITLDNGIAGCGANAKDAAWFTDTTAQAPYRTHLTMLLQRYRGEPAIAWFEYFNEPGFANGALRRFYDEMGALAASIDPSRLFSSGTIADYAVGGANNYRNLNESPGVDVASLHEYDANRVESQHGPVARANSAGKPVIVGEFGIYASRTGQGQTGDGHPCRFDVGARAQRFGEKAQAYITIDGYAGALAWAWQPGDQSLDICGIGNLSDDLGVQRILRITGKTER